MKAVLWILIPAALAVAAYLFALLPRRGEKKLSVLRKYRYAHRGLHNAKQGVPENSVLAYRYALAGGFGAEIDVRLTADGQPVVIHDNELSRLCGVEGKVSEMTLAQLRELHLQGTKERIPLFGEVLALFEGKTPLIIELKTEGGNHEALCSTVCKVLEHYRGEFCLESFDPRAVYWLRRNEPFYIRGQLTENYLKHSEVGSLGKAQRFLLTSLVYNIGVRPDFIACRYEDRKLLPVRLCVGWMKAQEVSWTIRSQEDFDAAVKNGAMVIFENFLPERKKKKAKQNGEENAKQREEN